MSEDQSSSKYVLVIDLGTSGPKVGLVDQQGRVTCSTSAQVKLFFPPDGGAEHDPAEWWAVITACVKKVIQTSRVAQAAIIAIAVTSQWSVTLPVDENGEPLMNVISWMDGRGAQYNREIVKGFPNIQGYKLSTLLKYIGINGVVPSLKGIDSLGHMLFIKNERPEIYRRTYKFFEPMDYVNMRLTGKFSATQNTVWMSMMIDNRRLDAQEYDPWLLKMGGIDREKLPDLLPIDGIIGTITSSIATELGLSPDTRVVCGVNDNSTSAVGAGAIADGDAVACLGTSGHLAAHVSFKKTDLFNTMATMPSGIKGRYLFWGDLANNGNILESYLKNLIYSQDGFETGKIPGDIYERVSQVAARVPPGSEGVIFLPWFNGILAPGEDPHMRGAFLNLSPRTSRAHLTRAVFEGLAMNWRWLRGPAEKLIGKSFQYWRLTGGGALSDVWSQIMADVVGLPMHRQADPRNNNVIGMGLLAFNRLGLVRLEDIPKMIKFDRIFEPDPKNQAVYDRMYAQFITSKNKIRPVFHALNKS
ncbi:MAG: FGGY-family carbohydrate kinase [Anaerolineales bacterium]|jgi:xylulokinase